VSKFIETSFSTARAYFKSVISVSISQHQSLRFLFSDSYQPTISLSSFNFWSSVQISTSALCLTLSSLSLSSSICFSERFFYSKRVLFSIRSLSSSTCLSSKSFY